MMADYPILTTSNQPTTSITLSQLNVSVSAVNTFTAGDAIYNNAGTWTLATASDDASLCSHVVTTATDTTFTATTHGTVTYAHGFAVGDKLYLTQNTGGSAGVLVNVAPATGRRQLVAVAISATQITVINLIEAINGPVASTDNAVAVFDGTTGIAVKNTAVTIDGTGKLTTSLAQLSLASAGIGRVLESADAVGNTVWALREKSRDVNLASGAFQNAPTYGNYGAYSWTNVHTYWFDIPDDATSLASVELRFYTTAALTAQTLAFSLLDRTSTTVLSTAANMSITTTTTLSTQHLTQNNAVAYTPNVDNVGQLAIELSNPPANMFVISYKLTWL